MDSDYLGNKSKNDISLHEFIKRQFLEAERLLSDEIYIKNRQRYISRLKMEYKKNLEERNTKQRLWEKKIEENKKNKIDSSRLKENKDWKFYDFLLRRIQAQISMYENEKSDFIEFKNENEKKFFEEIVEYPLKYKENIKVKDNIFYQNKFIHVPNAFGDFEKTIYIDSLEKYMVWGKEYNIAASPNGEPYYDEKNPDKLELGETKRKTDALSLDDIDRKYGYSSTALESRRRTVVEMILMNIFSDRIDRVMASLKDRVGKEIFESNYVFINRYKDGNDTLGAHSDDDSQLVPNRSIVSLSFGSQRRFRIRRKKVEIPSEEESEIKKYDKDRDASFKDIILNNGDILIMLPLSQKYFTHEIPIESTIKGIRYNLTFRLFKTNKKRDIVQIEFLSSSKTDDGKDSKRIRTTHKDKGEEDKKEEYDPFYDNENIDENDNSEEILLHNTVPKKKSGGRTNITRKNGWEESDKPRSNEAYEIFKKKYAIIEEIKKKLLFKINHDSLEFLEKILARI